MHDELASQGERFKDQFLLTVALKKNYTAVRCYTIFSNGSSREINDGRGRNFQIITDNLYAVSASLEMYVAVIVWIRIRFIVNETSKIKLLL